MTSTERREVSGITGAYFSVPDLDSLRAAIDRTDAAIADLLVRRVRLAQRVALVKHLGGLPARDHQREDAVRQAYAERLVPAGWTAEAVESWMDALIDVSTACQASVPIAYQGGPGSWSHASLTGQIPYARPLGHGSFQGAWRAACADEAVAAWLPVSNTQLGAFEDVQPILDEAVAWYEVTLPVPHTLVGVRGVTPAELTRIFAHPKARAQCANALARVAPDAQVVEVDDAAAHVAAVGLADDEAALGCPGMAQGRWSVLATELSDKADNATTFQLLVPRGRL